MTTAELLSLLHLQDKKISLLKKHQNQLKVKWLEKPSLKKQLSWAFLKWFSIVAVMFIMVVLKPLLKEINLDQLGNEIRRRSEAAMKKAIREVPDGVYHGHTQHDGFEEPIIINATVTVKGDKLSIDYTGSSAQVPRAVNVVPIYTFAYSAFAVKALLCPDVPNNEGSFTPITTSAPNSARSEGRSP